MRAEKRPISDAEDEDRPPPKKQKNLDALSVHLQALLVEYLPRLLGPTLEPVLEHLLRKVVREEVPQILMTLGITKHCGSLPKQIQESDERKLELHFMTRLPDRTFTGRKLKGKQEDAIEIRLIDATAGNLISSGPESCLQLDIVALYGDCDDSPNADWAPEHFERYLVKERAGKGPLLRGDLRVALKNGIATTGELSFTDNSSWTRSDKFRLGVRVAPGHSEHIRVREAISDAFSVRENRGEHYEKHKQPDSTDKVWRLKGIAKDGPHHKALAREKIFTVEDFQRHLVMDPARLRDILGSKLSKKQWESMVEHSMRCIPSKKVYTYYDGGGRATIVFNSIFEIKGLINERYIPAESFSENEKVYLNFIKLSAYRDHSSFKEYNEEVFWRQIHQGRTNEANPIGVETFPHLIQHEQDTGGHADAMLMEHTGFTSSSESLQGILPLDQWLQTDFNLTGQDIEASSCSLLMEHIGITASISQQPCFMPPEHTLHDYDPAVSNERGSCSSSLGRSRSKILMHSPSSISFDEIFHVFSDLPPSNLTSNAPSEATVSNRLSNSNWDSQKAVTGWLKLRNALRFAALFRKISTSNRVPLVEQGLTNYKVCAV